MDRIKFLIEDYVDEEGGYRFPTINIYINNRNLIDLVSEVEYRGTDGEHPKRSSYIGFETGQYGRFRCEMLAMHKRPYSILLTCTCTHPECSCIVAEVSIQSEMVIWSEIRNPGASSKIPPAWLVDEKQSTWHPLDYSDIGVFVFRRQLYLEAVDDLARNWRIGKEQIKDSLRWSR
jgi:hypothetical protein